MENYFIIGMPSSGKTTLGKQLAIKLGFTFVDMDELIVTKEGKSIAKIFEENGEDYFRKVESEVLLTFNEKRNLVISTGGGAPCFYTNMEFIKQSGQSIFLDVLPHVLYERIMLSPKNDRPLMKKEDSEQLLIDLENKYLERRPFYTQADITINGHISLQKLLIAMGDSSN